jgi:hypothetical protein
METTTSNTEIYWENMSHVEFLNVPDQNININFLKSMMAAELIDFMMNLVIYPCVVILHIIVQ